MSDLDQNNSFDDWYDNSFEEPSADLLEEQSNKLHLMIASESSPEQLQTVRSLFELSKLDINLSSSRSINLEYGATSLDMSYKFFSILDEIFSDLNLGHVPSEGTIKIFAGRCEDKNQDEVLKLTVHITGLILDNSLLQDLESTVKLNFSFYTNKSEVEIDLLDSENDDSGLVYNQVFNLKGSNSGDSADFESISGNTRVLPIYEDGSSGKANFEIKIKLANLINCLVNELNPSK
ncbi:MAG: hypothetical protein Q9M91_05035 [Candidatus Dojkabacteria bacterium]|nr:hypothetical protein [Candidatus Dojkabacteria bacterium]MDQ7021171.1 hypothetical protein [Candidatus Dojkabacteria bacterium]